MSAAEDPERVWLRDVYKRGARQLTVRAVISGMLIGMLMCLSNLYVVLKTGWSLGVTVTACIIAFALFSLFSKVGLLKAQFSPLENNAMGSVASAAGYMTGGGNMAAVPALFVLTGAIPNTPSLMVWFGVIAALGVFAAIPIKRQLINIEQLPFPTGIATAETITSLHEAAHAAERASAVKGNAAAEHSPYRKSDEAAKESGSGKAKYLGGAALIGALIAILRDAKGRFMPFNLPDKIALPGLSWGGFPAMKWTVGIEGSLLLVGAGAIMGFRVCLSLLVGALLTYGFLCPWLVREGIVASVEYKVMVTSTLWPAAAMMLAHGLTSFAFQWRSVVKSFSGLKNAFTKKKDAAADEMDEVECPAWWFPAGFLVFGPIVVLLMVVLFGIPWWAALMALPLSVVMGVVAARVTGETDVTPTKALGPATQFIYGAVLPGNLTANVMGANVTGGVGLHSADLLTDLKSGYLLGANPRKQVIGQLFGVVAGALIVVPAFNLLIPEASVLGSDQFPAPGVQVWAGVSKALAVGVDAMHPTIRILALIGAVVGLVLALAEKLLPKRFLPYIPSASGLGIAMVVPGWNAVSMFIGGATAEIVRRVKPGLAAAAVVPVSSGFIAGESLLGIAIKGLIVAGVLAK
jgi:OPT family oligopeptide transporter